MDERRKHQRVRARIPCTLLVATSGKRYSGLTSNISFGGAEFESAETMTRPPEPVVSGVAAILTFQLRRMGIIQELKFPCRVRFVAANRAGLEYTATKPTAEQRAALEKMLETRSDRID